MQFEVIRKSHKKEIMIGTCIFIILAIVLIVRFTFAKYELVKSIKIAEGTINYKVPDFKIMAMYKNDGDGEVSIETMPESGYTINENKSYCELNGSKDNNAKIYTDDNGNHVISKITKGSRCYLYFDKELCSGVACKTILGNVTLNEGIPDFSKIADTDEGVYKAVDNDGISYYFRGAAENNYLKFANKYWRIIRINGDGTIRLIYDGSSVHANGTSTTDSIAIANQLFNSTYNNNAYVGFQYTVGQPRGLGTKSNVLQKLETWYTNNLSSYAAKIDTNAGFCGDRAAYTDHDGAISGGGTSTVTTYYGGYIRLYTNKSPILTCADVNDLYTTSGSNKGSKSLGYPIGLISADEVAMVGGVYGQINRNYYLYNGQHFWTLSPSTFSKAAHEFYVNMSGALSSVDVNDIAGLRPVINLKSDITITTGKGTASEPYVVS